MHADKVREINSRRLREFLFFNALQFFPSLFFPSSQPFTLLFLISFSFLPTFSFPSFLPSFLPTFVIIFLYMTCFKFLPIASAISISSPCFIVLYFNLFLYLRYKMSWTETWTISSVRTYVRQ